jgi:hypothetical protein
MRKQTQQRQKPRRDARFYQYLDKARGGDEIAIHDLWIEFQFDYAREGGRDDLD